MMTRLSALLLAATLIASPVLASEGVAPHDPAGGWSFKGFTGTYNKVQLQRGYQVYKEVCAACHSMKLLSFRHLAGIGFNEAEIKALAAEATVTDGPDDTGEMFQRPGRPSDRLPSPFANDNAARSANGGALPPDFSLIAKARAGGPSYIYSILTGYAEPTAEEKAHLMPGMNFNKFFPGQQIAMAPPLAGDGQVAYGDGTNATVDQMAQDVSAFLMWTAEPHQDERKKIGFQVLVYLLIFAGIMFAAKKKLWRKLH